jgi:folylpolyglutamate synthase/dihydropteroate synthase
MQVISASDKVLLFDGAHNVAAAANLATTILQLYGGKHNVHAVVAHTGTHDGVGFAAALAPALSSVIVTVIPERGQCPDAVEDAYLRAGLPVAVVDDPKDALQHAIDGAGAGDIILITGSFYLAEAMRMYLPHGWTPAISTLSA